LRHRARPRSGRAPGRCDGGHRGAGRRAMTGSTAATGSPDLMPELEGPAVQLVAVRGPSALGGGRRRALELLYLMASTEFKRNYFGTVLGYLWSVARPLMLFGVLYAVFTQAFHVGGKIPHYAVLLLLTL